MVRRRIGAQGGKEGDILMMEPFKEGLGFGISRPPVDPVTGKDQVVAERSAGASAMERQGVPSGRALWMASATFFVFPVREEYSTSIFIMILLTVIQR